MSIVGNVIGSASSGGAKLTSTQHEDNGVMLLSLDSSSVVVGNTIGGGGGAPKTLILKNEDGTEIPIVLVGSETIFTADANDIREGKVAATSYGKVTGTKVIPAYHTYQGFVGIPASSKIAISISSPLDLYDYTQIQCIVCAFNTTPSDSVSAQQISVGDSVYNVLSTEPLSTITKDHSNKIIDLGIVNNTENVLIVRYFTYKEIE